jgi:acyl CoA:acetate/3-ketoacid CoA transferase alpha subunit
MGYIRGTRAVSEKWERVDQAMAFVQRVDEVGYVRIKKKAKKNAN